MHVVKINACVDIHTNTYFFLFMHMLRILQDFLYFSGQG